MQQQEGVEVGGWDGGGAGVDDAGGLRRRQVRVAEWGGIRRDIVREEGGKEGRKGL